jgi:23S rRNA (uracil1939-C5)-methyltransferase
MAYNMQNHGDNTHTAITLKIDSLAYGPYGIGRKDGRVILVPRTAPGDEIEVRIVEAKGNYSIGELKRIIQPSPVRQSPPCPYVGRCGGCPWQHVQYEAQLAAKEKAVEDALSRIGRLGGFERLPILRSPKEYSYRRRIRLQADDLKRLGFHRASSRELVEIDACLIAEPELEQRLAQAREWIRVLKTQMRHLEVVRGDAEGAVLFAGKGEGNFAAQDEQACSRFLEKFPAVTGLILFGRGWRRAWGQDKIEMRCEEDLKIAIDGETFSQVNQEGNARLVGELLQWADLSGRDRVLELYCGAGNFTLPMARRAREVIAIEGDARSVASGKSNSRLNRIANIRWLRAPVPRAVRRLRENNEQFTQIVLNPPRSGAKGIEDELARLGAKKILYVSCNPATLARDLSGLSQRGYKLTRVRPVDLFPQTFHVETLAEMVRMENEA